MTGTLVTQNASKKQNGQEASIKAGEEEGGGGDWGQVRPKRVVRFVG